MAAGSVALLSLLACDLGSPLPPAADVPTDSSPLDQGGHGPSTSGAGGAVGTGGAPAPKDATVVIKSQAFVPKEIEVPLGTTVRWVQKDAGTFHFIVEGKPNQSDAPLFQSPRLDPGDSWEHRFDQPGTFTYFCSNHSTTMRNAKVTVVGAEP